jgi:hypothetical protein
VIYLTEGDRVVTHEGKAGVIVSFTDGGMAVVRLVSGENVVAYVGTLERLQ